MKFLGKINRSDIFFIIFGIVLVMLFFKLDKINVDMSSYKKELKNINKEIKEYEKKNDSIRKNITKIDASIINLNKEISGVNNNIERIKIKTNEKIIRVDNYTFSDLQNFFTDRYEK